MKIYEVILWETREYKHILRIVTDFYFLLLLWQTFTVSPKFCNQLWISLLIAPKFTIKWIIDENLDFIMTFCQICGSFTTQLKIGVIAKTSVANWHSQF